jgi:predicted O-methyltransferase YrrM
VTTSFEVLARIREQRRNLAEIGPAVERAPGDFDRVALPDADANVLRDLLIARKARTMIEIGLAYGSSALAIGEALASEDIEGGRHLIIDAFQEQFHNTGWNAIVGAGLAEISSLISQRSQLALPRLVDEGFTADAAFVDGSHIFHNVFVDLFFLRELVRPGGLIILDDCHYPSVAAAVRYFELNTGWQPVEMPASRLRAYRLPERRVEPSFENFKPFV